MVARRPADIQTVADLKGKRSATIAQTSAGYFLRKMLERDGGPCRHTIEALI